MAELAISVVVARLANYLLEQYMVANYLLEQYKVMEGMEKQHKILKRELLDILDIMADAEKQASHREGVKAWLEELKTVAYKADDVFDEFNYEALRRKAKKEGHITKLGIMAGVKLFSTHNRVVFRNMMGNKLSAIVETIEVLVAEMNAFGFKHQLEAPPAWKEWRETDHNINDLEDIVSRSRVEERNKILEILLNGQDSCDGDLMVVPIVGMGGLGKTTLARHIYNDPPVQKHFQLLKWVCVSDDFDVRHLANKICNASETSLEEALMKLQDEIKGKRRMRTDGYDEPLLVYELRYPALRRTTNSMRRYKELFFNDINSVPFVTSLVSVTTAGHPHAFFINLSSVTFALSSTAFLNLLRLLAGQPAHISKSPSALARVHMARQHIIQRNIQAHIHTLVVTIILWCIKCSEMSTEQSVKALQSRRINRLRATFLRKLNRRCIQAPISCLRTGKTTRPKISSVYVDSGASIVLSDVGAFQGCISTPKKKKALSAHEHLLDHMLRSAVSDRTYVRQRNLTEERSDKPRTNSSTPATNSSDDTTHDPLVQNKRNPDGENENHSGPDACVDDRDTSASKGQAKWYMATGAARHATGYSNLITNLVPLERAENSEGLCVHAADGTPMPVLGHGSVVTTNVVLPDVYYVPGLLTNLVSVGQLAGLDYSVGFGRGACIVSGADGETVGRAHAGKDGLYEVEFLRVPLNMR